MSHIKLGSFSDDVLFDDLVPTSKVKHIFLFLILQHTTLCSRSSSLYGQGRFPTDFLTERYQ